ncbi:MAG TPA: UvrD-helicase domain-containing protein [Acidimicrobiales bacterium]|nr:UvrD-helicase domain-containing protein [Acidimicrobiales bacterium]
MSEPQAFDFLGALPGQGITMLEASAGTGKTFTIAALVTRYVAAGVPIDRILAVTFTRMATAELRGRVRDRLVSAHELLTLVVDAGVKPPDDDMLVRHLAEGETRDVVARRDRLSSAIANFDAATITTTHGFCHLVLAGLGIAGSVAPGSVLTDDPGDTVAEVVEDLYVRWVLKHGRPFSLKVARSVAGSAVSNPDTPVVGADPGSDTDLEVRLARAARDEVGRRLVEAGLLTYDDLLVRLKESLVDPERGRVACQLLRDSYAVVLVDEFQDTDPIQWDVVKVAFGTGQTTLVMIGDPKQAIYSFRGGDVHCYLDATASANARFTLAENWRSDAGLLTAYDALIEPLHLGHPDIPYRVVGTPAVHSLPGIDGLPIPAPMRLRVVGETGHPSLKRNKTGFAKGSAEEWIARDLADDIVRVLRSGARLTRPPDAGLPVAPGHIAVLVKTNRQAAHVEVALSRAGVPAVMGSTASVFTTEASRDWLTLLEALEQPASRARVAALALTPFVGFSAREVATIEEDRWEDLHARVHNWTDILRRRGVAALFLAVMTESSLPGRVLALQGGARLMTDLGHIAQLLHTETSTGAQGASALRAWLARRCTEASSDESLEERSRRLDSDADAVQVLTIHRAKGLEFPIVYCPYLWDAARLPRDGEPVVYHERGLEPVAGSSRRIDVSGRGRSQSYEDHRKLAAEEQKGEDLRLLYVALTRARHQAVVWWVGTTDSGGSPLGRLLSRRAGDAEATTSKRPKLADLMKRIDEMSNRADGTVSAELCGEPSGEMWEPTAPAVRKLEVAEFGRRLDRSWRRSSYSSMTAAAHAEGFEVVSSEPEEPGTVDEPDLALDEELAGGSDVEEGRGALSEVVCPLSGAPGGTQFGTFVHHVLERVDFSAPDLAREVGAAVAAEMALRPADIGPEDELVNGLVAAIETPLGPLAGGIRLRDVGRRDRLDELSFEFPLAGGDRPTGSVGTSDIAFLLERHLDPAGPLQGYAARLQAPGMHSELRGYLTGSLDLVLRAPAGSGGGDRGDTVGGGAGGTVKYFVADYKTNRLGRSGGVLTAWHYRPDALDAEMQHAHYPLQAILYSVALHRYLRWRVAGYRPEQHLGGVLYLFVRGMTGTDCPDVGGAPCGVFAWAPPSRMVTELSDLLDGGDGRGQ